jgi:hypothetical protein
MHILKDQPVAEQPSRRPFPSCPSSARSNTICLPIIELPLRETAVCDSSGCIREARLCIPDHLQNSGQANKHLL